MGRGGELRGARREGRRGGSGRRARDGVFGKSRRARARRESELNGGQGSVAKRRLLTIGREAKYLQTCPGLILLLCGWFDELQVSLT